MEWTETPGDAARVLTLEHRLLHANLRESQLNGRVHSLNTDVQLLKEALAASLAQVNKLQARLEDSKYHLARAQYGAGATL